MTPEDHKAIARRFFEEVWNQQKLDTIEEVFAPTVLLNGQPFARDGFRQIVETECVVLAQDDRVLHSVFELSDVPGPFVSRQGCQRFT